MKSLYSFKVQNFRIQKKEGVTKIWKFNQNSALGVILLKNIVIFLLLLKNQWRTEFS